MGNIIREGKESIAGGCWVRRREKYSVGGKVANRKMLSTMSV